MKQSNIDKLEKYRPKLLEWVNDQTCHLNGAEKGEIMEVIRDEWDPNYTTDLWCGPCVVKMMQYAFRRMDDLLEKRANVTPPMPINVIEVKRKNHRR